MIALSVAKLNMFSLESEMFSLNKAIERKTFVWKVWITNNAGV